MAVFIELVTDPGKDLFNKTVGKYGRTKGAGLANVRRPTRGLEVKEDTYAYIKLIPTSGPAIELSDSSSPTGKSTAYANFILQSVADEQMDRHQMLATFGDPYIFMFGEAPRMLRCEAILINSHDFNWKSEFMANYEKYMRGSKSLEHGCRTYLFYDDIIVEGYMLNATTQQRSDQPFIAQLSFQLFVSNAQTITPLNDPSFPVHSGVQIPWEMGLVETGWNGEQIKLYLDQSTEGGQYWVNRLPSGAMRTRPLRENIYAVDDSTGMIISDEYTDPVAAFKEAEEAKALEELRSQQEFDNAVTDAVEENVEEEKEKTWVEKAAEAVKEAAEWAKSKTVDKLNKNVDALNTYVNDKAKSLKDEAQKEIYNDLGLTPYVDKNGNINFNPSNTSEQTGGFINDSVGGGTGATGSSSGGKSWGVGAGAGASAGKGSTGAGAYAHAGNKQTSTSTGSYANDWGKQTTQAGGYSGANGSLSFGTGVGGNASSNSSGVSSSINGAPTPFASVSARGFLR